MAHAKLSPSAASRWMACTPSAHIESTLPNKSSVFAEEGTLAHAICENMLRAELNFITVDESNAIHEKLIQDKLFTEEMIGHCETYVDFVMSGVDKDCTVFIEQRLDMTNYVPEGFGTADALVLKTKILKFSDLKYGKGIPVYAENNKQLMIYALGALNDYGHIFDVEEVHLQIVQPRLDNISVWKISVAELIEWAETELKDKAALAFEGKGEFKPGPHCGFCRAKAQCRALRDFNMDIAKDDFKEPALLTDEEIAEVLERKAMFTNWIESVSKYAFNETLAGKQWPGFKLVEGRSNRKYSSEEEVASKLLEEGFTTDITHKKPTLVGITELTKKIGKPSFTKIVEPLLIKPPGSPTLVPETDNRPAISAASDFDDEFQDADDLI